MSQNHKTLLSLAAELRAFGYSWEAIAKKVGRRVKTCQNWPTAYRQEWEAAYRAVEQRRFEETSKEAHTHLQALLRHADPKIQLKAEELWHKYGRQAYGQGGTMVSPAAAAERPSEIAAALAEVAQDMEFARARMDKARALKGLPPLGFEEFRIAYAAEMEATLAAAGPDPAPAPPAADDKAPEPARTDPAP